VIVRPALSLMSFPPVPRRFPLLPLAVILPILAWEIACGPVLAIGMRHDVPEEHYLALARNDPPFFAGDAPDFSSVAAICLPRRRNECEVIGTGVLIAPRCILTAAHVVLASPDSAGDFERHLQIRFGDSAHHPSQSRRVLDIALPLPIEQLRPLRCEDDRYSEEEVIHAEFHDLAVLILDEPVTDIPSAPINDTEIDLLDYFICIAGYGDATRVTNPLRRWWRNANLKRAAENVIDRVVSHNPYTEESSGGILLFDFDNGEESNNTLNGSSDLWSSIFGEGRSDRKPRNLEGAPYPGDSGGPAFAFLDSQWRVVGVSGYGTGFPADRPHATIHYGDILAYTNVKVHAPWIRRILDANRLPPDAAAEAQSDPRAPNPPGSS